MRDAGFPIPDLSSEALPRSFVYERTAKEDARFQMPMNDLRISIIDD
jgi:hypothetical protein